MKVSQIFTAPNQLTLLRMIFVPFIVINLVEGRYLWALVVFVIAGFSDGLDGLLARTLAPADAAGAVSGSDCGQAFVEYDVSGALHSARIPWKYTVVVFSRDISILAASAVLFAIAGLRNFSPSIFGKAQHVLADRSRVFRSFVCGASHWLGLDLPHRVSSGYLFLYDDWHCTTSFWCSAGCGHTENQRCGTAR